MNRSTHLAISAACFGLFILLLKCGTPASAAPCLGYNTAGECICIPNAKNFGYFLTTWRQWPGERRPHEDFPQSIGLERLPTPKGHEQLPVPMETDLPGIAPPSEEGILPPGGFQIDEAIPKEPIEPILPDALPTLPDEPTDLSPDETPEEERSEAPLLPDTLPGLPLDTETKPLSDQLEENPLSGGENENDGAELSKPVTQQIVAKPAESKKKVRPLKANWMAALHPGFRGDTHRAKTAYPSTQSPESEIVLQGEIKLRAATSNDFEEAQRPGCIHPGLNMGDAQPAGHSEEMQPSKDTPTALGGYCPVELIDNERWIKGEPQWSAVHHGRTYLFSDADRRQRFLDDTEHYSPACDGCDPVLTVDENRRMAGLTKHCVIYKGRLYMFSSLNTLQQFRTNPKRYVR